MSQKILQINFKFGISRTEYEQACLPAAQPIADVPGLRWKVWLMNEAEQVAGGIYLFDEESSVRAFLSGPIVASIMSNPVFSEVSTKEFDVMEDLTAITRGPVLKGVRI